MSEQSQAAQRDPAIERNSDSPRCIDSSRLAVVSRGAGTSRETYRIDRDRGCVIRTIRTSGGSHESSVPLLEKAPKDPQSAFDWCWLRQSKAPSAPDDQDPLRIVDLFAGCAQMSLGASEACRALGRRGELVLAVEPFPAAAELCRRLFPSAVVLERRIEKLVGGRLHRPLSKSELIVKDKAGRVDLLVGGPPCQGHSGLNNRSRSSDARNPLGFRMVRAAEILQARHVVIENVLGIKHDRGRVFSRMVSGLKSLGYRVVQGEIWAEHHGVAQRRHRTFLVASKSDRSDLDGIFESARTISRSFSWACGDLVNASDQLMNRAAVPKPQNQSRIDYLFDNDLYDLPPSQRPPCHRNGTDYTSSYGRILRDRPVQTITTTFQCIGTGRFVHPTRRRPITLREGARLQSIPDFVDFSGLNATTIGQLIGNAVPPKVLYDIALRLLWDESSSAPTP